MTAPAGSNGFVQLPGGYQPNPPAGTPSAQPPMPPGMGAPAQPAQPAAQPPAQPAPADPRTQFVQPGPSGQPFQPPAPPTPIAPPSGQPPTVPTAPAPAQPAALGLDVRLQGQGIPTELQGRSLGEVMQMYDRMRNIVLQQAQGQPKPPAAQPQPQPQPQTQPQGQPAAQPTGWDWRNPQESIARVVQAQLEPLREALQPVVAGTQQQAIKAARDSVAAELGPVFAQLEPQVMQQLQGVDPQTLQNPQMWRLALQTVVGDMALRGQAPQLPTQPANNQWLQPPQRLPFAGTQPMPNLNGFWTEQPTHGAPSAAPQLSAQQQWAAEAMGMSTADYLAWSGGIPAGGAR